MPDFEPYDQSFFGGPAWSVMTPKVSNRFVLTVDGFESYLIKKVTRPSCTFGEIVLDHVNTKRKMQGKMDWNDISMTLYDPISPSGAADVMEWVRTSYQPATGIANYPDMYKKNITLDGLDPTGNICETWEIIGAFILSTEMGEMDWANDQPLEMTITLKYDYAVLVAI